jgi:L-amino acid N-acyltransferase YncA
MGIRSATLADISSIARIYNEAVVERIATADTEPRDIEDRSHWFGQFDDRHPIWVDERNGKVVSYGNLFRYSPKDGYRFAAENSVYVGADSRGKGFGRAMLVHVLAEAQRLGFCYMLARIFAHNEASLKLHASLGFKELGVQRRIVNMDDRWYDVVLMDLEIISSSCDPRGKP